MPRVKGRRRDWCRLVEEGAGFSTEFANPPRVRQPSASAQSVATTPELADKTVQTASRTGGRAQAMIRAADLHRTAARCTSHETHASPGHMGCVDPAGTVGAGLGAQLLHQSHDWSHGTTLNVFAGTATGSADTRPVVGTSLGWEVTRIIA